MDEELQRYRSEQAHAYLERIRKMGTDCAALQDEVDDAYDRVGGIDYSRDNVTVSPDDDAMVDAVESIKRKIRDYVVKLAEFTEERMRASDAMTRMDDYTEAKALRLHYLLDRNWERVCVEMHYTYDGMMKLRRRALCSYYDVMPHTERDPKHQAV